LDWSSIFPRKAAALQRAVSATACLLAASCAGNPPITTDLVSGGQVCLALDWGSASRPSFFGWTAPDTMLLLPKNKVPLRYFQADAEGMVGVAASQPDRGGGGWIWRTYGDTLRISSQSPIMYDLEIEAVRPAGTTRASWKGPSSSVTERGQVDVQAYPCSGAS
jgi:hypothetical protein